MPVWMQGDGGLVVDRLGVHRPDAGAMSSAILAVSGRSSMHP
jgi:hypothetical protein